MNAPIPLNLIRIPLSGRHLIEASAGTGKTYTIAALFTRLVLETNLDVSKILVMTFTKAATEELRARLRTALISALEALISDETPADPFLQDLINKINESKLSTDSAIKKIKLALCHFDQASIYTIHGFCQRLLGDVALETNLAFDNEVIRTDNDLILEIADDFWRKQFYNATSQQLDQLSSANLTPESLASSVSKWVSKPYLNILPLQLDSGCESIESGFQESLASARLSWQAEFEEIKTLLLEHEGLKRNSYKLETLPNKLEHLDSIVNDTWFGLLSKEDLKLARLFTASELAAKTKKNHTPPDHAFFVAWEKVVVLLEQRQICNQQAVNQIRLDFLHHLQTRLKQCKLDKGILSYDDLLLRLHAALHSNQGTQLAQQILDRFPVALIDEFQDTDPVQYEIFDSIYSQLDKPDQALFLVGDPKQAIYSFRGADIYTYLRARKTVQQPWWTLTDNWRSSQRMVTAINQLFDNHQRPFWLAAIHYQAVNAARGEALNQHCSGALTALRCWTLDNELESDKLVTKANAEPLVVDAVCDEIADLLNRGIAGTLTINNVAVCGADIAVLVRTNQQGETIRDALTGRGIASVLLTHNSVFQTIEAHDIGLILKAVLQPSNEKLIRAALVTAVLGLSAQQIVYFDEDGLEPQQAWDQWIERFRNWHQLWQEHGFMRMFRAIIDAGDCYRRWLGLTDGERRLTNLLQIGELLNHQSRQNTLGLQGLVNWFERQQDSDSEEAELRLESDENLVKIVTIHGSKGLEYNLVFCPFLWDGKSALSKSDNHQPFVYHDPQQNDLASLDMGSDKREYGRRLQANEGLAEELRLLYVALTRAKYHCTIITGHISGIEHSALGWLLYGNSQLTEIDTAAEAIKKLSATDKLEKLKRIASLSDGAIQCIRLPRQPTTVMLKPDDARRETKAPRRFSGSIASPNKITSFTLLTHGVDHHRSDDDVYIKNTQEQASGYFPRGAQAGTCLHAMLEKLDFTRPLIEQQSIIEEVLVASRFGDQYAHLLPQVTQWLQDVLETPLNSNSQFCLQKITNVNRMNEVDFFYPVADLDFGLIKNLLRDYYTDPMFGLALSRLRSHHIQGWMRGIIDLVYCEQETYYLADYKSNWLGIGDDAYHPNNLTQTIADQHYYLQYLIYCVALHLFLGLHLKDYDYQRHFGGVYYLFIRGMSTRAAPGSGIYFDKPDQQLVENLSQLFSSRKAT